MDTKSSAAEYSIFDFLTRIVPGLVVILPFFISLIFSEVSISVDSRIALLGLGLIGLVTGEMIDLVRSSVFRVPSPFNQVIYYYTGDEKVLSRLDRADLWVERKLPDFLQSKFLTSGMGRRTIFDETGGNFQREFETHFELDFDSTSPYTLYSVFLNYMDSKMASRTRRYYLLRAFSQNLMAATLITGIGSLFLAVRNLEDPNLLIISFVSIFFLTIAFEIALVFSPVAYSLVDLLIIDYYLDKL